MPLADNYRLIPIKALGHSRNRSTVVMSPGRYYNFSNIRYVAASVGFCEGALLPPRQPTAKATKTAHWWVYMVHKLRITYVVQAG